MKKVFVCLGVLVIIFGGLSLASSAMTLAAAVTAQHDDREGLQQSDLKTLCLSATVTAIKLEIDRLQTWGNFCKQRGDQQSATEVQNHIDSLNVDLLKYQDMDVKDFVLPEKIDGVAWVGDKPASDSLLYVQGMTKSGPWYHLAGIVGDDYGILLPNTPLHMNFYPVYLRGDWGMDSSYVCVTEVDIPVIANSGSCDAVIAQKLLPGKRVIGEVRYEFGGTDFAKCNNYQVYLLEDIQPGTKGKLILDSKQVSFDITLSAEDLNKYAYIEFVSGFASKTVKLDEINDDKLEITLKQNMVLKKPVIYLYPTQEEQIVLTHYFKGEMLNTYPTYTDNWTVIAEPNGNLFNVKDKRNYKYLYWEGVYNFSREHYQFKSGFYVRNEDYVWFLQQKLAIIGLNENEINDFIVYWLPVMNQYKNCSIHFRINDNIDGSSVLESKPEADTLIRVFMEFSGVDNLNSAPPIPEQTLPTYVRKGFTLVEWGGAEIGNSKIE